MLLTPEQIFQADDIESETVHVEEWGGDIRMGHMSGYARDQFDVSCIGKNGGTNLVNIRARMIAACALDENGDPLFSEKEVIKLGKKNGAILDKLYTVAQRLNKINDEDVEELAKN